MKDVRAAIDGFWNGFLDRSASPYEYIRAYQEGYAVEEVGDGQNAPALCYITYNLLQPSFGEFAGFSGTIWTSSTSFGMVDDVLSQAMERVPESGFSLVLNDKGMLSIHRANPFIEYAPQNDPAQLCKAGRIHLIVQNFIL